MKVLNADLSISNEAPAALSAPAALVIDGAEDWTQITTTVQQNAVLATITHSQDGRVFSLVSTLRNNGYTGRIVVQGLDADQANYAFGVGADAVVIREGEADADWQRAASFISSSYGERAPQARSTNIIAQRHQSHR